MNNLAERLRKLGACKPALDWAEACTYISDEAAWRLCPSPDWLWWLLQKTNASLHKKAAWWCAERARTYAVRALRAAGLNKEAKKLEKAPVRKWRKAADAAAYAAAADAAYAASAAAYAAYAADAERLEQREYLRKLKPPRLK